MTENEMVGWHHQLDGHEFESAAGIGDGQGSLMCCSPWGRKELDMTEQLNWTDWRNYLLFCYFISIDFMNATCMKFLKKYQVKWMPIFPSENLFLNIHFLLFKIYFSSSISTFSNHVCFILFQKKINKFSFQILMLQNFTYKLVVWN